MNKINLNVKHQLFLYIILIASFLLVSSAKFSYADVSSLSVTNTSAIFQNSGGFTGQLRLQDNFSLAMDDIGDLDGDGNVDLVVGSEFDDSAGNGKGAIWILFLNSDATVKSYQKIYSNNAGFTGAPVTMFGAGVSSLGDVDGDNVNDIAVASLGAGSGGGNAIWILFMNTNGTVKGYQKIANNEGGFSGGIAENDSLGWRSLQGVGDVNGDGVPDLAAGAPGRNSYTGSVLVFFLNSNGTVKSNNEFSLADGVGNAIHDQFGSSIANLGDIDGDNVNDIAVGAQQDGDGYPSSGAVWIVNLNNSGTVKSSQKISATRGGLNNTENLLGFGSSVEALGDVNGDGITDVVVGEPYSGQYLGLANPGALWFLELNQNGTVKNKRKFENWNDIPKIYPEQRNLGSSLVSIRQDGTESFKLLSGGYVGNGGMQGGILVFNVNNVPPNQPPVLNVVGSKTITEGGTLEFGLQAIDPDNNPVSYSAVDLPTGATLTNGEFSWTTSFTQSGVYFVTFTASDGSLTDSETVSITVTNTNRAPVIESVSNQTVAENTPLVFSVISSDSDNDTLTNLATNLPNGAQFNSLTGEFAWTPNSTPSGTYTITFTTSDGDLSDSETVTIVVTDGAEPPVLSAVGNQTVTEGSNLEFAIVATDLNNDEITYSAINLPNGAQLNSSTGEFSWTPNFTQAGTYTATFTASDGVLTDSETIDIVVTNANRAPVLNTIGNKTVVENQTLTFTLAANDPDGGILTYSALNLPSGATFSGNAFTWTPTFAQAGNYENIEFTVADNGSPMELDVELITITVGNVNRAPELSNPGPKNVIEGSAVIFSVAATDPDGDSTVLSVTNLPSGATFNSGTGVFNWTPSNSQSGIYTPTFTAADDGAPIESSSVDVVITVGDDPTPVEQAQIIIDLIVTFNLPNNVTNSYMANLQKIAPFIQNGQIQPALNQLNAFINKVNQDYSQNKITLVQKNQFIALAQGLIADLQ